MPATYTTYMPGSQTYIIPFEYFSKDHVHVYLGDTETNFTFTTANQIQLPAVAAVPVTIRRITPRNVLLTVFTDGSTIVGRDLNNASRQLFFIAQELQDVIDAGLTGGGGGTGGVSQAYVDAADAVLQEQIDALDGGGGSAETFKFDPNGTFFRTQLSKNRDWFMLDDVGSISGNGTSDDTVNFMKHKEHAMLTGKTLHLPGLLNCRITDTIDAVGDFKMVGEGQQIFYRNDTYPNKRGPGSLLFFDHNGLGIDTDPGSVNMVSHVILRDFGILRPQPTPVAGQAWAPTPADFDLNLFQCSGDVDRVFPICSTNFMRIKNGRSDLPTIGTIKGQVFNVGLQVLQAFDCVYADTLHFWANWSAVAEVQDYMLKNAISLHSLRNDGMVVRNLFGIFSKQVLLLEKYQAGSAPENGVSSLIAIDNLYSDNAWQAVRSFAEGITVDVKKLIHFGTLRPQGPTNLSNGIQIEGQNSTFSIGHLISNNVLASHIANVGTNSRVSIDQFDEGTWNGGDFWNGTLNLTPGLVTANNAEITVSDWNTINLSQTAFSPYPLTANGAKRCNGKVYGTLSKGRVTLNTDANGWAYFPHEAWQIPTSARVTVVTPGAAGATQFRPGVFTSNDISFFVFNQAGGSVGARNDIVVDFETFGHF